jgi:hypothetical protein
MIEPVFTYSLPMLLAASTVSSADVRPGGNPLFTFQCAAGRHRVSVRTEGGRLVYRFVSPSRVQRTVVESHDSRNVFYRYQLWATSNMQQLRFQTAGTSYVIYNHFRAADYSGGGSKDQSGVVVLERGRLRAHYKCRSGGRFDEDHQLDRLPPDPMELPIL